nr:serine protease Hayan-like [Bactrocera oleae]
MRNAKNTIYKLRTVEPIWLKIENCEKKMVFIALIVALLQAASTEGSNHEPSLDDVPLSIYVDASKEIDYFISLAKLIDEKQRILEEALARLSAEVKATEERWNERLSAEVKETQRLNERLSAEVKATEKGGLKNHTCYFHLIYCLFVFILQWCPESLSTYINLLTKFEYYFFHFYIFNFGFYQQSTYSPDIATLHKRPAELACEKITSKLQSIGVTSITDAAVHLGAFTEGGFKLWELCYFALIDTRFVLTAADCLSSHNVTTLELNLYIVLKKVKAIHIHPEFSINPALNNIGLIEMNSEVEYTFDLYPACMYTSAFNPKSGLMERGTKVQIVADSECLNKHTTQLLPNQMCVKSLTHNCRQKGEPIFVINEETFSKHQLVGIIGKRSCIDEPYVITNVFAYLDFIESIVWPKKEN